MEEILNHKAIPWKVYKTTKGAGVARYFYGEDFIWIEFKDKKVYLYSEDLNDAKVINEMKRLADKGESLSTFINRNDVREKYSARYEWKNDAYRKF